MNKKAYIFSLTIIVLFLLALPFLVYAKERTVNFTTQTITLEKPDIDIDLTAAGKWFIQLNQQQWDKNGKRLYPDNDQPVSVITAQGIVLSNLDIYIEEAILAGKFVSEAKGSGLSLGSQTAIKYFAVSIDRSEVTRIYIRHDNQQYIFRPFAVLSDETARATAARTVINAQLTIIALDAGSNRKWK